ncbi:MAG: hypothetical protein ABIJ00_06775 [Candidatus Eisenbacteria bacterium]
MKKGFRTLFSVGAVLLLTPVVVLSWNFDYQIYGNVLQSPVMYDHGGLLSGGDGVFQFTLDDTGWPLDPAARFDHIWATYFAGNYDDATPGAHKWVGQIPGRFYIEATNAPYGYNGWCEGSINAKITVRDIDEDGILDDVEKWADHLFDGRLSKLCDYPNGDAAYGEMQDKWGWGAVASNYFSFRMPPALDTLNNGGNLTLMSIGCTTPNYPASWSAVKALYK